MEILRRVARDYVTSRVGPEDLPMKAAEALARGVDSPSLCELAGLAKKSDVRDIHDLFVAAMGELGEEIPIPRQFGGTTCGSGLAA